MHKNGTQEEETLKITDNSMKQVLIASVPRLYLLNTEVSRVGFFLFDAIALCFTLKLQHTEGAAGP